jgi:hypothetical protein
MTYHHLDNVDSGSLTLDEVICYLCSVFWDCKQEGGMHIIPVLYLAKSDLVQSRHGIHKAVIHIITPNVTSSITVALLGYPNVCLIRDIIISINGSSNTVADDFIRGLPITLSGDLSNRGKAHLNLHTILCSRPQIPCAHDQRVMEVWMRIWWKSGRVR